MEFSEIKNFQEKSVVDSQVLLTTIDGILASHVKLRRTNDAMFKAFVSAALNRRKLAPWLRMVFRCQQVMEECYASWSYICVVGTFIHSPYLHYIRGFPL
ncbi:hypothetical protein D918_07647 [Trichuris suis]|nr:hypothetical protein D918_07647 [Trichuris suis]